jgi:hypothetical protein
MRALAEARQMIRREFAISDPHKFVAGEEYSVFEWARLYIDLHPAVASMDRTVAGQEDRLRYLGAIPWPLITPGSIPAGPRACGGDWVVDTTAHYAITYAVYQELADDIQTGRLEPKRRVYLEDRQGVLDPTLCVLDAGPILKIARRRGDGGEVIQKLLAERRQPTAPVEHAETAIAERKLVPKSRGHGGRREGSGAFDDTAPITEMLQLLASEKATSAWDAATKVAKSMPSHSLEATTSRIYRKFRDRYGTDPPPGKTWSDIEHELDSI